MIKLIAAIDEQGGIGLNNSIPWVSKADMTHFKKTTTGSVVVMGRKTYESIGKALPNRTNIVISKNPNLINDKDVTILDSVDSVIAYYDENCKINGQDMYIIGGSSIYDVFNPYIDEYIISKISGSYNCDAFLNIDLTTLDCIGESCDVDGLIISLYTKKNDNIVDNIISTVGHTNKEVISNIMKLYNIKCFDLDCTYSTGAFWKGLPSPIHKTDLYPKNETIIQADSGDLPFDDKSMNSIMFDPPFVIVGPGKYHEHKDGSSIIAKRFEGYANFNELKNHYYRTLKETYRLLKDDGILVLKCQDTVSGGRQHITHSMVFEMARSIGFQGRDMFILLAKSRLNSFNGKTWKRQLHARKYHSYFLVFKKCKERVDYTFNNN